MKRRVIQKTVLLLGATVSVFCLASCSGMKDQKDQYGMSVIHIKDTLVAEEALETDVKVESETQTEPETNAEQEPEAVFVLSEEYQYGNMQKNLPAGNFMSYEDQILFTHYSEGRDYFYTMDKSTGKVNLVCQGTLGLAGPEPGAGVAVGIFNNLEQYDGMLYARNSRNKIVELRDGRFEKVTDCDVDRFWHANNKLYAVTTEGELVVFEEENQEPRVLMKEYKDYWNVVVGHYLYGCSSAGVRRVDLSAQNPWAEVIIPGAFSLIDGEAIYYIDESDMRLYCCDMNGENSVQMTEQPILPASINVDDKYLYFRYFMEEDLAGEGSREIYRLQKDNLAEPEKIAELPDYAYTIYTVPGYDEIFVVTHESFKQDAPSDIYAVAKDGSRIEKLGLPDSL